MRKNKTESTRKIRSSFYIHQDIISGGEGLDPLTEVRIASTNTLKKSSFFFSLIVSTTHIPVSTLLPIQLPPTGVTKEAQQAQQAPTPQQQRHGRCVRGAHPRARGYGSVFMVCAAAGFIERTIFLDRFSQRRRRVQC